MKSLLSSRALFAVGFLMLAATDIVVLAGVASNRSGNPEARIILTERELQLPYRIHEENSGLALRLAWRALGKDEGYSDYPSWKSPVWFSAKKLEELGFNIDNYLRAEDNSPYYKQPIPKEVLIVLENNGEPYREALRRAEIGLEKEKGLFASGSGDNQLRDNLERAENRLKRERTTESRLFAIDAGLDLKKLKEKYDDPTRFIITKGLVQPSINYAKAKKEVVGYIRKISVENIHVPLNQRQVFDAILMDGPSKYNEFREPRYKVELAYGSRLEPWILSVQHMSDPSN